MYQNYAIGQTELVQNNGFMLPLAYVPLYFCAW